MQILAHGAADRFGWQTLLTRHRPLAMNVGADQAGIDREAFATGQTLGDAKRDRHLEQFAQQVTVAEPAMPFFEKVEWSGTSPSRPRGRTSDRPG